MAEIPSHPADRMLAAVDAVGSPVCVGLDPVIEKMPRILRDSPVTLALEKFTSGILRAVAGLVPCVKLQSACYERHGPDGVRVLADSMALARELGLVAILDGKRGDIGISAEHYEAALFGPMHADWATVNPYLGMDTVRPFLARGGAFALVRTSNPGSDELQSIRTSDGSTVAQAVARLIAWTGAGHVGKSGFSSLGAVVGATKAQDAVALRELMPQQLFLVPGYGAQGGTLEDALACFRSDGLGAIITASRSVIYAFGGDDADWISPVARAAEQFAREIRAGVAAGAGRQ